MSCCHEYMYCRFTCHAISDTRLTSWVASQTTLLDNCVSYNYVIFHNAAVPFLCHSSDEWLLPLRDYSIMLVTATVPHADNFNYYQDLCMYIFFWSTFLKHSSKEYCTFPVPLQRAVTLEKRVLSCTERERRVMKFHLERFLKVMVLVLAELVDGILDQVVPVDVEYKTETDWVNGWLEKAADVTSCHLVYRELTTRGKEYYTRPRYTSNNIRQQDIAARNYASLPPVFQHDGTLHMEAL